MSKLKRSKQTELLPGSNSDEVISDLMKKRKLQQEALIKIMDHIEKEKPAVKK